MLQQRRRAVRARLSLATALCASIVTTSLIGAEPTPIKLALFDFELEDFSAGASATGTTPEDSAQLASVTRAVRDTLLQSGRYLLIDSGNVDDPAVRTHKLSQCDGCDAAIASKLGAQQSLVGVVSRISRTEYVVKFELRETRTGAVLTSGDSGLRMGADYSWARGAAGLIRTQLLEKPPAQ
jgi:hypothetical protein